MDAAIETTKLKLDIDAFEVRLTAKLERLQDVWQSVEWCDSGDTDEESIKKAIEIYRNA